MICLALLGSRTNLFGQSAAQIEAATAILEDGLRRKDVGRVREVLAEDISISTNMGAGAVELLKVISANRDFESVSLDSLWSAGGMEYARVLFETKQDGTQPSVVAFDGGGKIVFVDFFDRLFGQSRYWASRLVGEIPFGIDGHSSVVLTIGLNDSDRKLRFLLDTGADGMAINRSLADELGLVASYSQNARVVGGQARVEISSGNRVRLTDSLSLTGQNIAIFDDVRHGMDGIIGLNLIKNYITKINYDRQKIYLYTFGDLSHDDAGTAVPFRMRGGLVTVPSVLGLTDDSACQADFLFDTGADYKLIVFSDFVRDYGLLESGFRPESMGTTVSLGLSTPVYHGTASELTVGDIVATEVPVTLQAASRGNSPAANAVDGSIGVRFWSEYNITIDLLRKQLYITTRE
jgi:predicted aspartyl protease